MRIFLTGRSGQVGAELEEKLASIGELTAPSRAELDFLDPHSIQQEVRAARPQVIVNAAAYTAVDRAESERASAYAVNCEAVGTLAEEAKRLGALLVHLSTDYVFSGEKASPYLEDDRPGPLNVYGESKLAGELALADAGCRYLILRTSWVYSERGRNFLRAILARAKDGKELRVVNDQRGAPTSAETIARAVVSILKKEKPEKGLYHMSAAGETTWHGFAEEILAAAKIDIPVVPVPTSEYKTAAARPKNSLLDNSRLRETFGIALPDWREGLAEVSSKIAG